MLRTPGPIFYFECVRAARRWQMYAMRSLFLLALLVAVLYAWWHFIGPFQVPTLRHLSRMGEPIYYGIVGTQLAVVLLAAPASAAGAICLDRARGTLAHVLVTDISAAEIVLGKLAASLARVLSLVLASLPVLALSILLGGVDPEAVFGAYLLTVGVVLLGCSLALTLSIWGKRTHEVLLFNYFIWLVVLLIFPACMLVSRLGLGPVPEWAKHTNAFWQVLAPYRAPGESLFAPYLPRGLDYLAEHGVVFGLCVLLSVVLMAVATWRLRPVVLRELSRSSTPKRSGSQGWRLPWRPSLDRNPIVWLVSRRVRFGGWMGLIWVLYIVLAVGFSVFAVLMRSPLSRGSVPAMVNGFQVAIGLLFVGILSVTKLAEDRARQNLDLLLTTPLWSRSIVWGYWWGAFRPVLPLLVLPVSVSLAAGHYPFCIVSTLGLIALVMAYGAALASLGVGLAIWMSRAGRAIILLVTFYAAVTVGWVIFVMSTFSPHPYGLSVIMGSPWFGALVLTGDEPLNWEGYDGFIGGSAWLVVYCAAAWVLFELAVAAFDQCVGRLSVYPIRMPLPPGARRQGRSGP